LTLKGSGTPLNFISGKSAFDKGTSTVQYTSSSGVTSLSSIAMEGSNGFNNLVINGTGTFNIEHGILTNGDLTVTAGTLANDSENIEVHGAMTGNGIVNFTGGAALIYTVNGNFGGNSDWTFSGVGLGEDGSNIINSSGSGAINVTVGMDINGVINAGSKVWNFTGTNGTPLGIFTGSLDPGTSTFVFSGNNGSGNTTIPGASYYNLTLNNGSETYTSGSGTLAVGGNLNITAGTLDLNSNDPTTTVTGNITIDGTLTASNTNPLTLSGNFTNNGTFTHSNGTVNLTPSGYSATVGGSNNSTFYNLSIANQGNKDIRFANGRTFGIANGFTVTGSNGSNVRLVSDSGGSQWTINYTGNSLTLNYVFVQDSACSGNNMQGNERVYNGGNNGNCWRFVNFGVGNGNGASGGGSGGGTPPGGGTGQGGGSGGSGGGSGGGTTLPDSFTGTNGTALATYSSSWTINGGNFQINTNAVAANNNNSDAMATWNPISFSNDQYAEVTLSALTSGGYIGVTVRGQVGAFSGYGAYSDSNTNVKIIKWEAGTPTVLYNGSAFAASDVLRLEVSGTTLTLKKNGSIVTTVTDSTYSSGRPGLSGYGNLTGSRGDDFNAGSISQGGGGGGGPTP
jgi:hypothetical protein